MANNVTMSFANIIKIKGYYLFYGNILKMKKLCFGKEIDFPTTTAIPTIQKKLRENGSAPAKESQESQGQVPLTRRNDIILNKVNTKMI